MTMDCWHRIDHEVLPGEDARVDGLLGVSVSNLFGLPLFQVVKEGGVSEETHEQVETLMAHVLLNASEMGSRLPMKACRSVTTTWGGFMLVQAPMSPLALSLIAERGANEGLLLEAVEDLRKTLEPVREQADEFSG